MCLGEYLASSLLPIAHACAHRISSQAASRHAAISFFALSRRLLRLWQQSAVRRQHVGIWRPAPAHAAATSFWRILLRIFWRPAASPHHRASCACGPASVSSCRRWPGAKHQRLVAERQKIRRRYNRRHRRRPKAAMFKASWPALTATAHLLAISIAYGMPFL